LKIVLDDGSIAWFLPESLRLIPTHAERWVERRSSFVADSPRRIRAFEVICVNYDSTVPAWFDNIRVAAATAGRTTGAIAFIQRANDPQSDWKSARDALANTGQRCEVVPSYADFSAAKLLIVPEWEEDQQFYWRSKLHHYFGGRLLLRELPASQWARALASYLWDEPPERLRGAIRVSTDGRAVHVPKNVAIAPETLAVLLRSESRLPANLPMRDYGPKPVRQIREGCLYVGDRPLLLRAVGCYDAPGNVSLDEHERVLAEYDRLGFNGLVLYVPWSFDEARFAAFLAVARRHGMHLMIWMHGPAAGAYSEKPLKDEWVFRALQFCQHPAILGWILCDDTFHHHMSFVSREAEVFRRYDRTNLVTATLMDPRAPSRVSEEGWKRWRDILDFR
jgi:hypothetical protein